MANDNYNLYELRHNIMALITQAQITPATAFFVIKDIYQDIKSIYEMQVEQEMIAIQKKEQEKAEQVEKIEYRIDANGKGEMVDENCGN